MKRIISISVMVLILMSTLVLAQPIKYQEIKLNTNKHANPFVDVDFRLNSDSITKAHGTVIWDGGTGDSKATAKLLGSGTKDTYAFYPYANCIFDAKITRIDNTNHDRSTYISQVEVFTFKGQVFQVMMG